MRVLLLLYVLSFSACGASEPRPVDLFVTLAHGSAAEIATRDQLARLAREHDLTAWTFTTRIAIDEDAIPHSHPVLTLHTRHLASDDQLLSTFIHEQIHWLLEDREALLASAVARLRTALPGLPVGFPDGADSERSSYEHLVVIALERRGLAFLVGEARAAAVLAFWESDHYRALYRAVREHRAMIDAIADDVARPG